MRKKELWEQEKDLLYFEQIYKWCYKNHKIIRRFRCIDWWTYWNGKTWIKKQGRFLGALLALLAASLVQLVIPSAVKVISGRGVKRAGRGYMDEKF